MNFYKHFIGDFQRDTGHLSLTERGAYLCLMHHYYATEKPLPNDHAALCRIAGAIDVIQDHDGPDTLHFVDPPYVHETRRMRSGGGYRHELDDDGHRRLLAVLRAVDGMVVLCGYENSIYADLEGWERRTTVARISGGRGTSLRTEVAWINPACSAALQRSHGGLFAEAAA